MTTNPTTTVAANATTAGTHAGVPPDGAGAAGATLGGRTTGRPHFMHPNDSPVSPNSGSMVVAPQN